MINSVHEREYRRPEKKPTNILPHEELGGALGGEMLSSDLNLEQQESLLQKSGMQVTGASFFLRHGETPANQQGDGIKGWKEPLTADELTGNGSIARSGKSLKSALGSLQNLQIHVSPTVRCLQTLQLVLQEFEVEWKQKFGVEWKLTDDKIKIIEQYNTPQDDLNLIIADDKLDELREKLGLPGGITLSNELNTRLKGDEEGEDLKPLFEPNSQGGGYIETIGKITNYIDRIQKDRKNRNRLLIGHRTLPIAGELAEKRDGYIPVHPQSDPGQIRVTAITTDPDRTTPLTQKTIGQISSFVLPFPPTDWIKQHQKLIPGLDPKKTYVENQNTVSAWMLGYAQNLHTLISQGDIPEIIDQAIAAEKSKIVTQTFLSVLLVYGSEYYAHNLLIQVLDHAVKNHHADTDWITTTFQRLIDHAKTSKSKSESKSDLNPDLNPDLYWEYMLAGLPKLQLKMHN